MKMILVKILYPLLALGLTFGLVSVAFRFGSMSTGRQLDLLPRVIVVAIPYGVLVCRIIQVWFPRKRLFTRWKSLAGTALVAALATAPTSVYSWLVYPSYYLNPPKPPALGLSDDRIEYPELPIEPSLQFYQWSFRDLEGNEHSMAEFEGKVLFLNTWATWCGPCKEEMPGLQALYDEFKGEDRIQFALISTEELEVVRQFADEQEYTFPILATTKSERPPFFKGRSLPFTVIFTPEGEIAYQHRGAAKWDTDKTRDFLRALVESG